jgi:hypothetical protein
MPRPHPLLMSALLAALFLRALVPEGFMPAKGELVELCTLHGPVMVMTDPLTGELREAEDEHSAPPCPFALILGALAGPTVPYLDLDQAPGIAPDAAAPPAAAARASLALPQARAPPLLS